MNRPAADDSSQAVAGRFVIFHLSGMRRGRFEALTGDRLRIGTAPDAEIRLPTEEPQVAGHHATLHRRPDGWELATVGPRGVWVNGERVERARLRAGDLIEVGQAGPVLRLRHYPAGSKAYKSPAEAFGDCVVTVANLEGSALSRALAFATGVPRELATQTSLRFRALVLLAIAILGVLLVSQIRRGRELEERLEEQAMQVTGLAELLQRTEESALEPEDLALIEAEFSGRLTALEDRSEAAGRVIGAASSSVVFLQGSYGYVETASGLDLRLQLGRDGRPRFHASGEPLVGVGGDGPLVEALFTGTGFVATPDGLLLTNKHVATPWEFDRATPVMRTQGFEPRMRRFVAELTGGQEIDFWRVVESLAEGGYIAPLATRGIVGQVTDAAVVYDAETTSGGSGGPVIDSSGAVVAVNSAVLPEFGGSNLGVPAAYARRLIERPEPAAADR